MELKNQIRSYIIENFLFGDASKLKDDVSLLERGIFDSTGILEVVTFLETTFSISVADSELLPVNLDSINNIVKYLERKKSLDIFV